VDLPKKTEDYPKILHGGFNNWTGKYYAEEESGSLNTPEPYVRKSLVNELIEAVTIRMHFIMPERMFEDVEGTIKTLEENNTRVANALHKLKALEAE